MKVVKWIKNEWREFVSARKKINRLKIKCEQLETDKKELKKSIQKWMEFCSNAYSAGFELINNQKFFKEKS
jgi:hypothetical protein